MKNNFKSLMLGCLVVFSLSNCKKDSTSTTPNPAVGNVAPKSAKPTAKPDVASSVKNESAKSSIVASATKSTKAFNGINPVFSKPQSTDAKVITIASGNSTFGRVNAVGAGALKGWVISKVSYEENGKNMVVFAESESQRDDDCDGQINSQDDDDDNDGTVDTDDKDDDNDGTPDTSDSETADTDSDGIANSDDLDDDGDGVSDEDEEEIDDSDNDGTPDDQDTDDDGDGTVDSEDTDDDGDGKDDNDLDGDGTPNDQDNDDDGDGTIDSADTDDDGDGISDDGSTPCSGLKDQFDFAVFYFSTGEYMVYDPSSKDDAWDWGYWYMDDATEDGDYLCLDLGSQDEAVLKIEDLTFNAMETSFYEDGVKINVDFSSISLN